MKWLLLLVLAGCGSEVVYPFGGDASVLIHTGGTTGTGGAAGRGTGGSIGTGGAPACQEPTIDDCRQRGTTILTAEFWCSDTGHTPVSNDWGTCSNGRLVGYYAGLPCPFDVGIAHTSDWRGPCPECLNSTIITNDGGSTSAAWRNTPTTRYCCAGQDVKKIQRCL